MRKVALLLAAVALGFAPAPFPRPDRNKDDLKEMRGDWAQVSLNVAGQGRTVGSYTLRIDGDRLTWLSEEKAFVAWAVTLDSRKKPKSINATGVEGSVKGAAFVGVYKLEGDTLTICYIRSPGQREETAGFDPSKPGVWLEVFKRKKPAEK